MNGYLSLVSTLTTVLILTAGCMGGRANDDAATPTSLPAPTSAPTATVVAQTPPTPTASAQATPAETVAPVANDALATALTVEEEPEILSYRMRVQVVTEGPRGTDTVQIEGAYIKQPPAEQITINFDQGGQSQKIETMLVDGTRYMHTGEM